MCNAHKDIDEYIAFDGYKALEMVLKEMAPDDVIDVVKKSGLLGDYKFYPAVMNSHARLTYTEVAKVFNGEEITNDEIIPLKDDLNNLHDLYKVLKTAREKRGGIEFESKEVRFIFDDTLDITDVVDVVRNDAHMMIEECMIAANVCAAKYVKKSQSTEPKNNPNDTKVLYNEKPMPNFEKDRNLKVLDKEALNKLKQEKQDALDQF